MRPMVLLLLLGAAAAPVPAAGAAALTVAYPQAEAAGAPAPVAVALDLDAALGTGSEPDRLELLPSGGGAPIAAQFEAERGGGRRGTLWFQAPPGRGGRQEFRLHAAAKPAAAALTIRSDPARGWYEVADAGTFVLRYNQGTVPVPPGIPAQYARGDYIMPLHGLEGEVLTDDYPPDHPHHRGLGWSWPVTRWGNEVRDIWAVSGVWARPVAMRRLEAGPVFARLEAENVWKWGDTNPIVREEVSLRVFRRQGGSRFLDVELRLTALADGVAIGGRPHGGYGGFGLRAMPATERVITAFTDPPERVPRRSWIDYSGRFAGGRGPAGLAILEDPGNLHHPNALHQYPELNYVMPAFPGEREVPLARDRALTLRHRVWIHTGMADAGTLAAVWAGYTQPPAGTFARESPPGTLPAAK